eukprot:2942967-Pyramimonas_sp.AAC.1
MAADPAQASQINDSDSDEIKKSKLAAQLTCFEASIQSLPKGMRLRRAAAEHTGQDRRHQSATKRITAP